MNDKRDLQDLASNLDKLTEEGGPLLRLVCEVRKSNTLATRNVRLQMMSLFALFLCLACLLFLSFIFYEGLEALEKSEAHLAEVTSTLATVQDSVGEVKTEVDQAPKIVADDSGRLKVVAQVRLDDSFTERTPKELKKSPPATKPDPLPVSAMSKSPSLLEAKRPSLKRVEIPIDVKNAAESDD